MQSAVTTELTEGKTLFVVCYQLKNLTRRQGINEPLNFEHQYLTDVTATSLKDINHLVLSKTAGVQQTIVQLIAT